MKDGTGGATTILVEPPQPATPVANMQAVPQSTPAPQASMAMGRAAEGQADAIRSREMAKGEMAKERRAETRTDATRANDRAPLPVAEWIALIRRLRAEGKVAEAVKELAAFRAAHPDHEKLLPHDLAEWRPPEK